MNVSLTPELEQLVNEKVESGMYHTASEVIRESLRLLQERDEQRQGRLEKLRAEIQVGLDQLKRGEGIPAEEVFERLHQKSKEMKKRQRKA